MKQIDIEVGLVFQFVETNETFTIIWMTDDGYYFLAQNDFDINIWATESLEMWIDDGDCRIIRKDNIETTINFKKI